LFAMIKFWNCYSVVKRSNIHHSCQECKNSGIKLNDKTLLTYNTCLFSAVCILWSRNSISLTLWSWREREMGRIDEE
jgi:late competence protein required for DNA uptake (superfamily II DNA/RNA helicase)